MAEDKRKIVHQYSDLSRKDLEKLLENEEFPNRVDLEKLFELDEFPDIEPRRRVLVEKYREPVAYDGDGKDAGKGSIGVRKWISVDSSKSPRSKVRFEIESDFRPESEKGETGKEVERRKYTLKERSDVRDAEGKKSVDTKPRIVEEVEHDTEEKIQDLLQQIDELQKAELGRRKEKAVKIKEIKEEPEIKAEMNKHKSSQERESKVKNHLKDTEKDFFDIDAHGKMGIGGLGMKPFRANSLRESFEEEMRIMNNDFVQKARDEHAMAVKQLKTRGAKMSRLTGLPDFAPGEFADLKMKYEIESDFWRNPDKVAKEIPREKKRSDTEPREKKRSDTEPREKKRSDTKRRTLENENETDEKIKDLLLQIDELHKADLLRRKENAAKCKEEEPKLLRLESLQDRISAAMEQLNIAKDEPIEIDLREKTGNRRVQLDTPISMRHSMDEEMKKMNDQLIRMKSDFKIDRDHHSENIKQVKSNDDQIRRLDDVREIADSREKAEDTRKEAEEKNRIYSKSRVQEEQESETDKRIKDIVRQIEELREADRIRKMSAEKAKDKDRKH